jgi:predicted alpha/beta-fold hydrolase
VASTLATERALLIDGGRDLTGNDPHGTVRLLAYYNPRLRIAINRGVAVLLHGWEGSSHSTYNLEFTNSLTRAGYDVFRLNLRDHGPNLHYNAYALNPGIFLGTLIDEVGCALQRVADLAGDQPLHVIGSSLGGNFALRLGMRQTTHPIPNLRGIIAINPAINPERSTTAIDLRGPFRRFFRSRWLRSLLMKQQLFPELYDFAPLISIRSILQMTEYVVQHYSPWQSANDYFRRYTITGSALEALCVKTTIITAFDDEIVPVADFYALGHNDLLTFRVLRHGGHLGYLAGAAPRRRLSNYVLEALAQLQDEPIQPTQRSVVQSGADNPQPC